MKKLMTTLAFFCLASAASADTTNVKLNDEQLSSYLRQSIQLSTLIVGEATELHGDAVNAESVRCMRIGQLSEQTNLMFIISQNSNFTNRKGPEHIVRNIVDMKDLAQGLKGFCGIKKEDSFSKMISMGDRQQLELGVSAIAMAGSNVLHALNP